MEAQNGAQVGLDTSGRRFASLDEDPDLHQSEKMALDLHPDPHPDPH